MTASGSCPFTAPFSSTFRFFWYFAFFQLASHPKPFRPSTCSIVRFLTVSRFTLPARYHLSLSTSIIFLRQHYRTRSYTLVWPRTNDVAFSFGTKPQLPLGLALQSCLIEDQRPQIIGVPGIRPSVITKSLSATYRGLLRPTPVQSVSAPTAPSSLTQLGPAPSSNRTVSHLPLHLPRPSS